MCLILETEKNLVKQKQDEEVDCSCQGLSPWSRDGAENWSANIRLFQVTYFA